MKKYDFLIAAGGTGGHIFPALSLIVALQKQGFSVIWAGEANSMEEKVAKEYAIEFMQTSSPMWTVKSIKDKLVTLYHLLIATKKNWVKLQKVDAPVVVGFGGYVSVAIGLCAFLQRRKLILHEQNVLAGKANKLLARFAYKVMLGFPDCIGIHNKTHYTGNPVREEIKATTSKKIFASPFKVLILGGSKGSHSMNVIVANALTKISSDFEVWHQSGVEHIDETKSIYDASNKDAMVVGFIDDMSSAYNWADVIITRAGALSIAESVIHAIPTILVPNPRCAGNHQLYNAQYVASNGAGFCIVEDDHAEKYITEQVLTLFSVPKQYDDMRKATLKIATTDATKNMLAICIEAIRGKK